MNGDPNLRTLTPKAESRHVQALAWAMNGDPPSLASLGAGAGQSEPRDQESRDPKPSNPNPESRNLKEGWSPVTLLGSAGYRTPQPQTLSPAPSPRSPTPFTMHALHLHLHPKTLALPQLQGYLAHKKLPPPRTLQ